MEYNFIYIIILTIVLTIYFCSSNKDVTDANQANNKEEIDGGGKGTFIIIIHILLIISLFYLDNVNCYTILFQVVMWQLTCMSITGGYHRLWTHKSYNASKLLEIFYLIFGTLASQSSVIWWSKTHRTHHRNEEKDGDPYNITKGFYHAHIGWLLHGNDDIELAEINKTDVSDLEENELLKFQDSFYPIIWVALVAITILIPIFYWNETLENSFFTNIIRILVTLHSTWLVNSLAHMSEDNGYNEGLNASENTFVSIVAQGEGWHSYHHRYPKDYRASEPYKYNPTTWFIDLTKTLNLSSDHYVKGEKEMPVDERFNLDYYRIDS